MTTANTDSIREAIAEQLTQQAALRIVDVRPDELEMMIEAVKDVADEMPIEVAAYGVVEGFLEGDLG